MSVTGFLGIAVIGVVRFALLRRSMISRLEKKTHHADVVAIEKNFGQLRLGTSVVAIDC